MNYEIYLNPWHYPSDSLHVNFAGGRYEKHWRTKLREFVGKYHYNMAELKFFVEQVKENQHIVFHGGDTPTLLEALRKDTEWLRHLEGKTLYGISAGVGAMAYQSFNVDHRVVLKGMGLFPFQTIVHYRPDMAWMADKLYNTGCKLPVLPVPDSKTYRIRVNDFKFVLEDVYDDNANIVSYVG